MKLLLCTMWNFAAFWIAYVIELLGPLAYSHNERAGSYIVLRLSRRYSFTQWTLRKPRENPWVGCPRNKQTKNFGSNRNKPKLNLFRFSFGSFRCFGSITKQPKHTDLSIIWKINLIRPYYELHIYPVKSQKEHPNLIPILDFWKLASYRHVALCEGKLF
jgi:hypothetical protein